MLKKSCWGVPKISSPKRLGAVVADSPSACGALAVSDVTPELTSDGVSSGGTESSPTSLLSDGGSANDTTDSCGFTKAKSCSDEALEILRFSTASTTRAAISSFEKPRDATSSSREFVLKRLSNAIHASPPSAVDSAKSCILSAAIATCNFLARSTKLASVTTFLRCTALLCVFPCADGKFETVTSFPPNPNELEIGRRSHFGGCFRESVLRWLVPLNPVVSKISALSRAAGVEWAIASFVDWSEWIPIVPSKKAVASMSGLRGHQSTWNAQLAADGSCFVLEIGKATDTESQTSP